jgi:hypothetical protein
MNYQGKILRNMAFGKNRFEVYFYRYKQFIKGCILNVNKKWKLDECFPHVVRSAINNTSFILILSRDTIFSFGIEQMYIIAHILTSFRLYEIDILTRLRIFGMFCQQYFSYQLLNYKSELANIILFETVTNKHI